MALKRLEQSDRVAEALIGKLESADDPTLVAALAQALAVVAGQDPLSEVARMMAAVAPTDAQVDLELDLKF